MTDDAEVAPSITIHPRPTEVELAAIVAAVALSVSEQPDQGNAPIPTEPQSRWAAAGRREAMPSNDTTLRALMGVERHALTL